MSLFVIGPSARSGVFGQQIPPPATITPSGTQTAVLVAQFEWGPVNKLTYQPTFGQVVNTYAPAGTDRTISGYLALIRKAWPNGQFGVVRAMDPTAATATANVLQSATTLVTLTAFSPGTRGNSLTATIGPAGDGNANHWKLTVTLSGASGTTTETYDNNNVSGTGANVLPDLSRSILLSAAAFVANGVPTAGTLTFSGGTNGTTTAAHYVGTPSTSDAGLALLESDGTIRHVFVDDCGNALRPAVNAGLVAHGESTTNRMVYLNGNSGQTAAQAQTDVANYRSIYALYCDPWVYVLDDVTGAKRLTPSASFVASVSSQLNPALSAGWHLQKNLYNGINDVEFDRGGNAAQNTAAGITTIIKAPNGGFTLENDVVTSTTPGQTAATRTKMLIFIGSSAQQSLDPFVNAPNIELYQDDIVIAMKTFLDELVTAQSNPVNNPFIVAYSILPPGSANTPSFIQADNYQVLAEVQTAPKMNKIYIGLLLGQTVVPAPASL